MTELPDTAEDLRTKVNRETSKLAWAELQRHFASGTTVYVDAALDLVEVAFEMSQDNKSAIENWMSDGKVALVTDDQATEWLETDATLWAVVVKPWVLVQLIQAED